MVETARAWSRYLTPTQALAASGLACHGAGDKSGRLRPCGPRRLGTWAVVLIAAGTGWFRAEGRSMQKVEAPAVFWLQPGTVHGYGPSPEWEESWILFDGVAVEGYRQLDVIRPDSVSPLDDLEPVVAAVREVEVAVLSAGTDPLAGLQAGVALGRLMVTLAAHQDSDSAEPLLAELRRNAHRGWSPSAHAEHLRIRPRALRAKVMAATGMSTRDFLTATRLTMAKELLAQTDLGVAQVAGRLGIDDPAYFTRMFTRHVGVAPSVWRASERR